MKKSLLAALAAVQIPFLFYLGGLDFNERGAMLALCYAYTMIVYCGALAMLKQLESQ